MELATLYLLHGFLQVSYGKLSDCLVKAMDSLPCTPFPKKELGCAWVGPDDLGAPRGGSDSPLPAPRMFYPHQTGQRVCRDSGRTPG